MNTHMAADAIKDDIKSIQSQEELNQVLWGKELLVLFFSSEDCGVCHSVFPRLKALVQDYPVMLARINVNEQREISGQFLVFAVPTILIFSQGKEILRESRFINFDKVDRILRMYINK